MTTFQVEKLKIMETFENIVINLSSLKPKSTRVKLFKSLPQFFIWSAVGRRLKILSLERWFWRQNQIKNVLWKQKNDDGEKSSSTGLWLWLSWQSSRFRYQRSAYRIQSSALIFLNKFTVEKTKIKRKEAEKGPLKSSNTVLRFF